MRHARILTGLLAAALAVAAPAMLRGQASNNYGQRQETDITLMAGDTLEILPVTALPETQNVWTLSKDGNFLQAVPKKIFHARLLEEGTYTLTLETTAKNGSARVRKSITIGIEPPDAASPDQNGADAVTGNLVSVQADAVNDRVILPGSGILRVSRNPEQSAAVSLDLSAQDDLHGDGDGEHDDDTAETLFTLEGTPIHLWFLDAHIDRTLTAFVAGEGFPQEQKLRVISADELPPLGHEGGATLKPVIRVLERSDLERGFSVDVTKLENPPPLLYRWFFGDGSESMLTSPIHRYLAEGNYTVKLEIYHLDTGMRVGTAETFINIQKPEVVPPTPEEEQPEEQPTTETGGRSLLWTIILVIAVFIVSVLVGAGIVAGINLVLKKRGRGTPLSDKIESIEQTVLRKQQPPPLQITPRAPAPAAAPEKPAAAPKEPTASAKPVPPPNIEPASIPSWLKKSAPSVTPSATVPAAPKTPSSPPPAPAPPTPAPRPAPAPPSPPPQPTTPPKPPASPQPAPAATAPVPPWLQTMTPPSAPPTSKPPAAPPPTPGKDDESPVAFIKADSLSPPESPKAPGASDGN